MSLTWRGDEVQAAVRKELEARLQRAASILARHAISNLGITAISGKHRGRSRKEGTQRELSGGQGWVFRGKMKTFAEFQPSAPEEYPRRRTGHLRMNILAEQENLEVRWGTNVPYGRYLETGTRKMAPRPWMSLTNQAVEPQLRKILGGDLGLEITGGDLE